MIDCLNYMSAEHSKIIDITAMMNGVLITQCYKWYHNDGTTEYLYETY